MLHDFEEIIFFKTWINKNKYDLKEKYPKIAKRFLARLEKLSTQGFAVAIAEEFILLSLITLGSTLFNNYLLWLAVFMGFFIHLLIHLGQTIILKRYIPGIITTFFALIYCIYGLHEIITNNIFSTSQIIFWTIIGIGLVGINLLFAHKLGEIFDKK
jgi:hypothetical protein